MLFHSASTKLRRVLFHSGLVCLGPVTSRTAFRPVSIWELRALSRSSPLVPRRSSSPHIDQASTRFLARDLRMPTFVPPRRPRASTSSTRTRLCLERPLFHGSPGLGRLVLNSCRRVHFHARPDHVSDDSTQSAAKRLHPPSFHKVSTMAFNHQNTACCSSTSEPSN